MKTNKKEFLIPFVGLKIGKHFFDFEINSSFFDAFEYSPKNSFSQKIGGAFLFNKLRKFMTDYNNIQFVFAPNRYRSVEIIDKIFRMGEAAKTTDLEYLKDRWLL